MKRLALVCALCVFLLPALAHAYVGPGAGVAFLTTALLLFTTLILAAVGLLLYPFRQAYRLFTRKKAPRPARIQRAVIIGLDGLDPDLAKRFMDEGKLPNMKKLAEKGLFTKLGTTYPAMSPVAWSSFATGVNPSKHGIFDFLTRDPRTYLPELSSADVGVSKRHIKIGQYKVPLGKPQIRLLRKSQPFWKVLGQYRVPCSILRVPITFPPEEFDGTLLSAMCVPDLKGSQGSFTYWTSEAEADDGRSIGGQTIRVTIDGDKVETYLEGPPNPVRADGKNLRIPFSLELCREKKTAELKIGRESATLLVNEYSDWIPVAFKMGLGLKLRGIVRFRLLELGDKLRLYGSPVNIDPARPVMPISHPFIFSVFLSKLCGRFATLGLAEDTWALNEKVLDEDAFLEQAWSNHAERESQLFAMLDRTKKGLVTCVFDGTDRIQHMFMRYLDDGHPAVRQEDPEKLARYGPVIADTYARADKLIGQVMEKVDIDDPRTLLMVISDHGFKTFRRGVNLNSWLMKEGYLRLKEGKTESREWFRDVDWENTKAYALGLGGIFLNIKGREARGQVAPGKEAEALAEEIAAKLTGLRDPGCDGAVAIQKAYASHTIFKGPYAKEAPDLIVGYAAGWRASWDGVRGLVNDVVFDDNTKAWSGDHCIDPELVPGVLVSNWKLDKNGEPLSIADLAPTMLDLFGVPAPRYMDGRSLVVA